MAVKKLKSQNGPDPSTTTAAYDAMVDKWQMINDLLGGTSTMRAAGSDYLPQHPAEDDSDYNNRLDQNVLYNMTELTLNSLVGRVFREPMKLGDDAPAEIAAIAPDIDSCGNDLSSVSQSWFRESMAKGYAHILVDMPVLDTETKKYRTKADDIVDNRRPYWSLVRPENAFFLYWERQGGKDVLVQARIWETVCEIVGLEEIQHTQIRMLAPGVWSVWRNRNEADPKKKPEWYVYGSGVSDLPVVPLVTFFTNSKDKTTAKPPLEDLAYMNIRHWQSTSDQMNVLTVARFPILAASGSQIERGKTNMPIGPRQLMSMRDPNGRFYYVEHTGRAIAAGKEDIEALEDRMAAYGAEFLRRQVSGRTAFERAQDTSEAISPLKDMAQRFQQAVTVALDLTAEWLGISDAAVPVTINTKFTEDDTLSAAMDALKEARKRGDISKFTFLTELKRRGVLDETLDVAAEVERIKSEVAEEIDPPVSEVKEVITTMQNPDGTPIEKAGAAPAKKPAAKKKKAV